MIWGTKFQIVFRLKFRWETNTHTKALCCCCTYVYSLTGWALHLKWEGYGLLVWSNVYVECTVSICKMSQWEWSFRFCGQLRTGLLESSTMRNPFIMPTFRSLPRASTSSTSRYITHYSCCRVAFWFRCACTGSKMHNAVPIIHK